MTEILALSLVNVREEQSYPIQATQIVKSAEEKAANKRAGSILAHPPAVLREEPP
jgi:hypothetical protein